MSRNRLFRNLAPIWQSSMALLLLSAFSFPSAACARDSRRAAWAAAALSAAFSPPRPKSESAAALKSSDHPKTSQNRMLSTQSLIKSLKICCMELKYCTYAVLELCQENMPLVCTRKAERNGGRTILLHETKTLWASKDDHLVHRKAITPRGRVISGCHFQTLWSAQVK